MKKYTIDFFDETSLSYFGTLENAKKYVDRVLFDHSFSMKRLSILIKDGCQVVATLPWERNIDFAGEYFESQEWE